MQKHSHPPGEGDTGRAGGAGRLGAGQGSDLGGRHPAPPLANFSWASGPQVRSRGGAGRGEDGAGAGRGADPAHPAPAPLGRARVGGRGRSGARLESALWPGARGAGRTMPTNFTVVPVEARADGEQDEAAELAEAPGAPEGHEPDCSGRGERGRTCPRDKGGAGLRGAGAGGGRGGRGTGGKSVGLLSRPASPFPGSSRSSPHSASSWGSRAPSSLQSPRPSSVAGTQGQVSLRCPALPGLWGPPCCLLLLARLGTTFMPPPTPTRGPGSTFFLTLRVGQLGDVEGGIHPGVTMGTGEGPHENPGAKVGCRSRWGWFGL